jgi:hypothetical protein
VNVDATGTAAAEWAVLVYMAANNELAPDAEACLKAMEAVAPSAAVSVAVQVRTPGPVTTRYYRRGAKEETTDLRPSPNMGEEQTLTDFLDWGRAVCPASKYLLVAWGHGEGTEGRSAFESIELDDGEALTTQSFRQAIAKSAVQRVDVLGCDACMMSTIEVAFEMRDVAAIMVASETKAPNESWPYERILTALAGRPAMTPTEAARVIVDTFRAWYANPAHPNRLKYASLTALDLHATEEIAAAVKELSSALVGQVPAALDRLRDARASTQAMEIPDYIDLESFLDQLEEDLYAGAVVDAANHARAAFDKTWIDTCAIGDGAHGASGLSLYFPTQENAGSFPEYRALAFAAETEWFVFLNTYFAALRAGAAPRR